MRFDMRQFIVAGIHHKIYRIFGIVNNLKKLCWFSVQKIGFMCDLKLFYNSSVKVIDVNDDERFGMKSYLRWFGEVKKS